MPSLWNREVETYQADIFESSTLTYDRSIRLTLKPSGGAPAHTVSLQFPTLAPDDFVSLGNSMSTVQMDRHKFDEILRFLQTESPIFFTAYDISGLRFAGLTTDAEASGEGFRDADSEAA